MISDTLVAQILSLRYPGNSVGELRSFYDSVEGNLRALEARGKDIHDYDKLRLIIQEKLPKGVRVDMEKSKDEARSWTLLLLRTRLLAHIRQRECAENVISTMDSRNPESRSPRSGSQGAPRSSAQNLASGSDSRESWRPCVFCKGEHFPTECAQFPDLKSKKKEIQIRNLCRQCLGGKHQNNSVCRAKEKKCWYCSQLGHHQSLCPSEFGEGANGEQKSEKPVSDSGDGAFSALGSAVQAWARKLKSPNFRY